MGLTLSARVSAFVVVGCRVLGYVRFPCVFFSLWLMGCVRVSVLKGSRFQKFGCQSVVQVRPKALRKIREYVVSARPYVRSWVMLCVCVENNARKVSLFILLRA